MGRLWGLALAGMLVVGGCSDDDGAHPAATTTPTAPAATATATSPATAAPTLTPPATATASPSATPTPNALAGQVTDSGGQPLAGAMVTAFDDAAAGSVSVFADARGYYAFPTLPGGTYRVRAKRIGWEEATRDAVALPAGGAATVDFALAPTDDLASQLPASYFHDLLQWPTQRIKGDFSRACANCHQIGDHRFRTRRTEAEWETIVNRMIAYGGIPFFDETRALLLPTLASTFGPDAPDPHFAVPPPPRGEAVRAVIREWEIDPVQKPGCHDLELGLDGTVYTVGGVWTFNPATGVRGHLPVRGGGHSIERDAHGDMWITAPGPEQIIKLDVASGEFTYYDQPRIGDDLGSYPHTLRFDDQGRIWYTLTRSNHVCRFDPLTAQFTYYRLPPADPAISGVPIAVAYGCDVAPDQTIWWSQLFGHKIGRIDPDIGAVTAWQPPFDGPRRLGVGPDNVVWVPGYGSAELGRFDPVSETWKVYPLPTQPAGGDLPYNITVNRQTGDVWITGSNSDTLIRFAPASERFTVYQLPTPVDFTREIEFDDIGNVWTCTSEQPVGPNTPGSGRIIELELRERVGGCGDGSLQLGEDCDDGNTASCDGCSATCGAETGCGDGVACGGEACDDGNRTSCDGCSATCAVESGARCGDTIINGACGEECDPPGAACSTECRRIAVCGDHVQDAGETCDDGNTASCDGCSASCQVETGCGDGARCGAEACDDGNSASCDGCSPTCTIEVGALCGDGVVNTGCGEECDPPAADCSLTCRRELAPLGTRRLSFGGSFYSSALGAQVALGELSGVLDLVGDVPNPSGIAALSSEGPITYSAAILGGSVGYFCVRLASCTGFVDCNGGTAVDTRMVQDSAGPGLQGLPAEITTGLGTDGGPGSVQLTCEQTFVQLPPGGGSDCLAATYPAAAPVVYTTGTAEAFYLRGAPKVGSGEIAGHGEPFDCATWAMEDGPGQLAATFMVEEDPRAGDLANLNLLDD